MLGGGGPSSCCLAFAALCALSGFGCSQSSAGAGGAGAGGSSAGSSTAGAEAGTPPSSGGNAGSSAAGTDGNGEGQAGEPPTAGPVGGDACQELEAAATPPAAMWVNATGNLAGMASDCQNLAKVVAQPCSKTVIAGVALKGLWASDDAGKTWRALGSGGGDAITNRTTSLVFDPSKPDIFWETGIFGDGGVYATTDNGQSFRRLGMLIMNQLVAVDFTDPLRKTLVVGTHGMRQSLFRSSDGGSSFENIGTNLPADVHNSESPIVLDDETYLLGACGGGDGTCGIFRTTDAGKTWKQQSDARVSHFGSPLVARDGNTIYWPLFADAGMVKSVDRGLTWQTVTEGQLVGVTPVELPDGSLVGVGNDHLLRSKDGAKSWSPIGEPLPFSIATTDQGSLAYSVALRTFFLSHWDCGMTVLPDAVMSAGFDYKEP